MATKTAVNGQTVVHKDSDGQVNTFPDVCKTQIGNVVVPVPYSNTAVSKDTSQGSKSVTVDGNSIMLKDSVFSKSTGDEAGNLKGVMSGQTGGEARFVNYSFNVKVEDRNVCRRLDPMTSNKGNTPPAPLIQPNETAVPIEDKFLLPFALVFEHPDVSDDVIKQPFIYNTHKIGGPQQFDEKDSGYAGGIYRCDQQGEYSLKFKEWVLKEKPLRQG